MFNPTLSRKKSRNHIGKLSDIGGVISLLVLVFGIFPVVKKVDNIQEQLNQQDAQNTLMSYFSDIEEGELQKAFDLFSQEKKYNHTFAGFVAWLDNFVAFEGLTITPLSEKDSAIKKVFLAEFQFKKRGMLPIDSKRGFYLKYHNNKREIDYSNVLYENGWKGGACEFYTFDHCK